MKFKAGDKAKVIACKYGHKFNIGEVVTITELKLESWGYECSNNDDYWCLNDEELEPIESTIVIKENTDIKDFALQVVKYLEDHYGEHNNKAFLKVVNDKCSPTNVYELEWYVNRKWSVKERYNTFEKAELHKNILIKEHHYSADELRIVCQEVF